MKSARWFWKSLLALAILSCARGPVPVLKAAATLELYGTFHAMGVIVNVAASDDPDGDAVATVEYREAGGVLQQGYPLTRVSATRFVGSLFGLTPGVTYDVLVIFDDPDAGVLDGIEASGSAATRADIVIPAPAHSYYAAPAGAGSACSLATPCALAEALDQAQAGDEVVLRGGVYAQGEMSLPRSGAAGAPIVIRSHTGEPAIFDGGDPATFSWTDQGGGVYRTTVNVADTHLVTANGQRLYPYQSLSDLQNLIWETPGFYADGATLYVRLAGDADPNGVPMVVSRYNYAFQVAQNYIYFLDVTFRHYGQGEYAKALYFREASWNLVQDCTFAINDLGIGIKLASEANVIQNNEFYDTDYDWPWDGVKDGSGLETGGVRFYDPVDGRGNIIRYNTFHDYFDGFGACPESSAVATNETDVYENLVYRVGDDGMEADGRCSNLRIWGNTFHDVLAGISLAPVYDGPVYAVRNLIYRTGGGNNDYPGLSFKFNSGYDQSGMMYLFHNTADAVLPGSSGLDIKSPGSWTGIYARNNIWAGTEYALYNSNPEQPLNLDYDGLYTSQAGELAWWSSLADRHLNTLAELQSATGLEMHGLAVEPGFAAPGDGNYHLDANSDLIDAGVVLPGINDGYSGSAPDIGAYEFAAQPVAQLALHGRPASHTSYLDWSVSGALPVASTWRITYDGGGSTAYLPITGIVSPTRAYTLTGLANYVMYTVTLDAMLDGAALLSDTVHVMPTNIAVYLPLVMRE